MPGGKKKWIDYCKVTFFQRMAGAYQAGYLTNADQVTPDWLIEELISGRAEAAVKSWFGDVGGAQWFHLRPVVLC